MKPILMLTHRLPYPPNKGDKVRAYHWLQKLSAERAVHLGCFIDDEDDWQHLPVIEKTCASVAAFPLSRLARARGLAAWLGGRSLTEGYFFDARLAAWVSAVIAREGVGEALVYCSAMAQYVMPHPRLQCVMDFVDVDSAKWAAYAGRGVLAPLYRLESRRLLAFEKRAAERGRAVFFVTPAEAALFERTSGMHGAKVAGNGVDAAFFSPANLPSPYAAGEQAVVFTGVMDYWPNVDAVCWFAQHVWPQLVRDFPRLRFYVVGMRPGRAVRALASESIHITGRVDDVRPYLAHAAAAVAPLRVARGVQNKVLEAMAMARAVVVSAACADSLTGRPGREVCVAPDAAAFVEALKTLLNEPCRAAEIGRAARAHVVREYSWDKQWRVLAAALGEVA